MDNVLHRTDVAIVGAGAVGLFAVFECAMLDMRCHVLDALDMPGGQCAALYPEKPIYDIPGYPAIDALDLVKKLEAQAAPFHPVFHLGERVERVVRCPLSVVRNPDHGSQNTDHGFEVTTSKGTTISCKAILIAA